MGLIVIFLSISKNKIPKKVFFQFLGLDVVIGRCATYNATVFQCGLSPVRSTDKPKPRLICPTVR